MELSGRMAIDVAVETGDTQTRMHTFSIIGRVEFFLRKGGCQHPQPIELDRRENILEQTVIVIDGNHFTAGDIAQFWSITQKDGRGKLREERLREGEVDVASFKPRKHVDLHLRKDHASRGLERMGE